VDKLDKNVVNAIKFRAPLASGAYIAVIADAPKPREIDDPDRRGVSFTLKVLEGDAKGRLAAIELLVQARRGARRVDRDLLVLDQWCDCLGVDSATTLTELIAKLRDAAGGKRVEFAILRNEWRGGVELQLTAIRVLGVVDAR
jgi:hypothetical protein